MGLWPGSMTRDYNLPRLKETKHLARRNEWSTADDPVAENGTLRGARRNSRRQRCHPRVRDRRLGVHGCARHLPRGRHPLRAGRARAGRDPHGRRLRARLGPPRRVHRAERPRRDELRYRSRGGLLGAFPGRLHHPGDRLHDHGARRLSGDRAAADLLEDHQVPGPREQPAAHGRNRRALLRPRHARDGADPAQHSARLLLRRDRHHDSRAAAHRARGRRRSRARCRRRAPRGGAASR